MLPLSIALLYQSMEYNKEANHFVIIIIMICMKITWIFSRKMRRSSSLPYRDTTSILAFKLTSTVNLVE